MLKKAVRLLMLLSIVGWAGAAQATLITFDDLEVPGTSNSNLPSYSDQGFQFVPEIVAFNALASWHQGNGNYNTSAALFNNRTNGVTRLSAIDAALFDLVSIDLDTVYANNGPSPVEFRAYSSSNALVGTQGLTLTSDGWTTLNFTPAFSGVSYVEWTQTSGYHQFDNVLIDEAAIPEPATLALFGIGLAGLGFSRKKRKSA